jgi:hypothetical protein
VSGQAVQARGNVPHPRTSSRGLLPPGWKRGGVDLAPDVAGPTAAIAITAVLGQPRGDEDDVDDQIRQRTPVVLRSTSTPCHDIHG